MIGTPQCGHPSFGSPTGSVVFKHSAVKGLPHFVQLRASNTASRIARAFYVVAIRRRRISGTFQVVTPLPSTGWRLPGLPTLGTLNAEDESRTTLFDGTTALPFE
jgi:hypothetical protein